MLLHAVVGNIAAGKTVFARHLSSALGYEFVEEGHIGNPFLKDYYTHPHRWAFASQVYFLWQSVAAQEQLHNRSLSGAIQDRSPLGHAVFVRTLVDSGIMHPAEAELYFDIYKALEPRMIRPHFVLFLDVDPAVALQRVRKRNRPMEKDITEEYLAKIGEAYREYANRSHMNLIALPWNDDLDDDAIRDRAKELAEQIKIGRVNADIQHDPNPYSPQLSLL